MVKIKIIKIVAIILAVLVLLVLIRLFVLGQQSRSGQAIGLVDGKFTPCPDKPNCVNSEFIDDQAHYIPPFRYRAAEPGEILKILKAVILEAGGKIQSEKENYLAATFTISLFGFVDDLEIRQDETNHMIHVRSASRVGTSDLGVNRKRVELIFSLIKDRLNHNS